MGLIDAHVHVWTDDTAHYPLAVGYKPEDMKPKRFTPEDLFKHTNAAGVERINFIQMSFYGFDMYDTLTCDGGSCCASGVSCVPPCGGLCLVVAHPSFTSSGLAQKPAGQVEVKQDR